MPSKKKQKQAPYGYLFWIAFILLIFVLFFANREKIAASLQSLQESGFLPGKDETASHRPNLTPQTRENSRQLVELVAEGEAPNERASSGEIAASAAQGLPADVQPVQEDLRELLPPPPIEEEESPAPSVPARPAQDSSAIAAHVPTRQQRLFFVVIDNEGRVVRQEVLKDIPRSDSPLSDALNALFAGPSEQEAQRQIISLIPEGTRLLSAVVRDDVAYINVSEEFRFNGFGVEGSIAQLAQVVFTATTFPTVSSVQILIEGQRLEYLGGEGVWIGSPLARKDFN